MTRVPNPTRGIPVSGEPKRPRRSGDPMTPEGARPRPTTSARGGDAKPEGTKARMGGDPMSNTQRSGFVPRATRGPQGDSKTMSNPVK